MIVSTVQVAQSPPSIMIFFLKKYIFIHEIKQSSKFQSDPCTNRFPNQCLKIKQWFYQFIFLNLLIEIYSTFCTSSAKFWQWHAIILRMFFNKKCNNLSVQEIMNHSHEMPLKEYYVIFSSSYLIRLLS